MALINPSTLIGTFISRGKSPKQSASLNVLLDFSSASQFDLDYDVQSGIRNVTGIDGIQSVYVDNSNNGAILTIYFHDSQQTIRAPAYSTGIYPVFFSGNRLKFTASTTGNVICSLIFLNTREQAQVWSTQTALAGVVNVSGSTIFAFPGGAGVIDRSASLAVAGASQVLMPANGARKRLIIQNRVTALGQGGIAGIEAAYFNVGAPALPNGAGCFELPPGASYDTSGGIAFTDQINFSAATAGHYLVAKEF